MDDEGLRTLRARGCSASAMLPLHAAGPHLPRCASVSLLVPTSASHKAGQALLSVERVPLELLTDPLIAFQSARAPQASQEGPMVPPWAALLTRSSPGNV